MNHNWNFYYQILITTYFSWLGHLQVTQKAKHLKDFALPEDGQAGQNML
jgi:hypothetical protein